VYDLWHKKLSNYTVTATLVAYIYQCSMAYLLSSLQEPLSIIFDGRVILQMTTKEVCVPLNIAFSHESSLFILARPNFFLKCAIAP
jgi:hypothetical protein